MSIFLISPKLSDPTDPVHVETTTPPTAPEPTTSTSSDPSSTVPTDPSASEDLYLVPKEISEKTVLIDGPLSQVYTQALNQAYAKENYITTHLPSLLSVKGADVDPTKRSYLYVIDPSHLGDDEIEEAFTSLTLAQERYLDRYVCVEHDYHITASVASFIARLRKSGVKVLHSRESALETITERLQGI